MKINDIANFIALLLGAGTFFLILRKLSFGKKAYLYVLLLLPALFFSTYMLTDAVTTDEGMYIPAFSDVNGIEPGTVNWGKASFQYRVTQIAIAPFARLAASFDGGVGTNIPYIVYKDLHWLLYFNIAICILYIWGKYIFDIDRSSGKYRIAILGMSYILIGLPVTCLILKVCNYDAGSVYFATLAISLTLAAEKQKDLKYARWGGIIATLGCLEKWVGFIYLIICIAGTAYLAISFSKRRKILCVLKEVFIGFGLSVVICFTSFLVLRIVQGQGMIEMNVGAMLFPVIYMVGVLVSKAPYMDTDITYYDHEVLAWLMIAFCLILFTVVLFCLLRLIESKIRCKNQSFLTIFISACLLTFVVSGIIGCFVLHRKVYPLVEFPQDVYMSATLFNGVSYFYGAKTKAGHIIADLCFSNAALMASLPTIVGGVLLVSAVTLTKSGGCKFSFLTKSYYAISLILVPFFTLSGQPACARYFGVSIILMCLCSIYLLANMGGANNENIVRFPISTRGMCFLILVCLAFYTVEMSINLPIYNCFSPLWLVRDSEFYDTIRQGEWDAGEAMAWGEELAVSGKYLEEYVEELGLDVRNITIVTNYGINWYSNPGFNIIFFNDFFNQPDRNYENTYFILAKFKLYRSAIPEYIEEMEPIYRIRIKGETTAWIYAGNQLRDYYERTE